MAKICESSLSGFQLAAARRRLVTHLADNVRMLRFQLAAARRRLAYGYVRGMKYAQFQLAAARRRLVRPLAG